MIEFRRAYSIKKLRRNILFITKGDVEFYGYAGKPKDMFLHIYNSITDGVSDARFYNVYVNDLPIAYVGTSTQTKQAWFYVDVQYRTKPAIKELISFIHRKVGSEFYTGTKKTNKRFVDFANKNKWSVFIESNNEIIYRVCQ